MPVMLTVPGYGTESISVATEEELLEFVNRGRAVGGANILEALLPSKPGETQSCLIANALNFGCEVYGAPDDVKGFSSVTWAMYLPENMEEKDALAIARALDCEYMAPRHDATEHEGHKQCIILPEHIGNAAAAFDEGAAFREYRAPGFEDWQP